MPILAAFVLLLAGCKVDSTLTVRVRENGSGAVTVAVALDPAAVQGAEVGGGRLEDRVRLDDLRAKGWTVAQWQRGLDGARIEVTKPFANASEANQILAEVLGPTGPVRNARVGRSDGPLRTMSSFIGTADVPGATFDIARDSEVAAVLTKAGLDPAATDRDLAARLRAVTTFRVVADLPGERRTWTLPSDRTQQLRSESSWWAPAPGLAFALAAGLVAVAAAVLFAGRRGRRTRGQVG
ncbi:MAG: hypothetical protein ACOYNI_05880 [Acidimicrobiia bacterium]